MPLSRLEMIAVGLGVLGAASFGAGFSVSKHFRNQIQITPQIARVDELGREISQISWKVHDSFYRKDPKGYDKPAPKFLRPENRKTIAQAWDDYDRLMPEYDAAISQSGVKDLMEKNEGLRNSALVYSGILDGAAILLVLSAGVVYIIAGNRKDRANASGAQLVDQKYSM